jgi:hypothetical protein
MRLNPRLCINLSIVPGWTQRDEETILRHVSGWHSALAELGDTGVKLWLTSRTTSFFDWYCVNSL